MKRVGHLLERIADLENLRHALYAASQGKRAKADVIAYRAQAAIHLSRLRDDLLAGRVPVGSYRQFKVYEPKERIITVAPFGQRVLHHAIMQVCEPVFERQLIDHENLRTPTFQSMASSLVRLDLWVSTICLQLRPRHPQVPNRHRRNRQVHQPPPKDQRRPTRHRPQPPPR